MSDHVCVWTTANGQPPPPRQPCQAGCGRLYHADPDLGLCDTCGSEDGRRYRTIWRGVVAWLCDVCRKDEKAGGAVELSPMGAGREHSVSCQRCQRLTWNFSAVCNRCKANDAAEMAEGWERADEIGSRP